MDWKPKHPTLLKTRARLLSLLALGIAVVNAASTVGSVLVKAHGAAMGFAVGVAIYTAVGGIISCAVSSSFMCVIPSPSSAIKLSSGTSQENKDAELPDDLIDLRQIHPSRDPGTTPSKTTITSVIERESQPGLRAR
ncbi:hypothetical protein V5O48_012257 [Marasmius crinis-equi]|uniref:Uncharacterized protein n=1 Tax=Marasmius crinis-equi TaxID=585013 RepID=A0ABR3F3A1_9AGAR